MLTQNQHNFRSDIILSLFKSSNKQHTLIKKYIQAFEEPKPKNGLNDFKLYEINLGIPY